MRTHTHTHTPQVSDVWISHCQMKARHSAPFVVSPRGVQMTHVCLVLERERETTAGGALHAVAVAAHAAL